MTKTFPESVSKTILLLGKSEGLDLNCKTALDKYSDLYSDDLRHLLRFLKLPKDDLEKSNSYEYIIRILYSLIPAKINTIDSWQIDDYLSAFLKKRDISLQQEELRSLVLLIKRIRKKINGFSYRKTSLNLEDGDHISILNHQLGKCNICHYEFEDDDFDALTENRAGWINKNITINDSEVIPKVCFRTPVLDHIIPYYIGGNGLENYQILCDCCNTGKSDFLSSQDAKKISLRYFFNEFKLTGSLRFHILTNHKICFYCKKENNNPKHIFIKDKEKIIFLDNLGVSCRDCMLNSN